MNRRTPPRLSVALPVYNAERYLPIAVESILNQTFTDFELILCDNASTDGTQDMCREWAERDTRVVYHRNRRNIGVTANFALAADLCSAPLMKWAASDDVLDPHCLGDCLEVFEHDPDLLLVVPRGRLMGSAGEPVPQDDNNLAPIDWPARTSARVRCCLDMLSSYKRSIAVVLYIHGVFRVQGLPFRITMPDYPMSDQEVILRTLLAGPARETTRPSLSIRIHEQSTGYAIYDDPRRIWRTMKPDEPPPRALWWWHHKRYWRVLSVLETADLPLRERRRLQAHYAAAVGHQIAQDKWKARAGSTPERPSVGRDKPKMQ